MTRKIESSIISDVKRVQGPGAGVPKGRVEIETKQSVPSAYLRVIIRWKDHPNFRSVKVLNGDLISFAAGDRFRVDLVDSHGVGALAVEHGRCVIQHLVLEMMSACKERESEWSPIAPVRLFSWVLSADKNSFKVASLRSVHAKMANGRTLSLRFNRMAKVRTRYGIKSESYTTSAAARESI